MLCGGSIGLQADTVTLASERSIALQGNTVPQVRGNAPQIPCFTMPLEFPAPPSLHPLQGASALASADRFAGGQRAARIPCFTLAIARYRCGLRLVWHENPSLLFVPPRMKHYTSYPVPSPAQGTHSGSIPCLPVPTRRSTRSSRSPAPSTAVAATRCGPC